MHSYSALPGAFFFTLVLLLTIAFVTLVSKWKVYVKLGMPGWYSLVPIFSDRKLYEHVRANKENKTLPLPSIHSCRYSPGATAKFVPIATSFLLFTYRYSIP